jgi:hypothetical protein
MLTTVPPFAIDRRQFNDYRLSGRHRFVSQELIYSILFATGGRNPYSSNTNTPPDTQDANKSADSNLVRIDRDPHSREQCVELVFKSSKGFGDPPLWNVNAAPKFI